MQQIALEEWMTWNSAKMHHELTTHKDAVAELNEELAKRKGQYLKAKDTLDVVSNMLGDMTPDDGKWGDLVQRWNDLSDLIENLKERSREIRIERNQEVDWVNTITEIISDPVEYSWLQGMIEMGIVNAASNMDYGKAARGA